MLIAFASEAITGKSFHKGVISYSGKRRRRIVVTKNSKIQRDNKITDTLV